MEQRINIEKTRPEAYKAVLTLAGVLNKSTLTPIQKHLIKLRASQINCCSFCINMHTKEALHIGETQQRIFLLTAWKDTSLFTEQEKALLALTEETTLIHANGVSSETYGKAKQFFSDETIADIIMSTVMINAWNRIAVSTHMPLA
jgi:AhpD family alkylhydroperoxidase